jgi:thiamine biosynthesis lipoprotein
MTTSFTRRRFIVITGIVGAAAALPVAAALRPGRLPPLHRWSGIALGADASLQLYHPDAAEAARLIDAALAEVARLEKVFSLYRAESALSRLNRDGALDDPPQELVALLGDSERFARLTGGAFDVTVQPLWDLYAAHFARADADPSGPPPAELARALARVGHAKVAVDAGRVALAPGSTVTLNGIAQGYITDRVTDLLRDNGVDHTLVDMGETRAIGAHPAGRPWTVGIKDPRNEAALVTTLPLDDQAIATSGGYGTPFDASGRFNHIFDPATGGCATRYLSVSVMAPTATIADALSTALSLLPLERARPVLAAAGATAAWFVFPDRRLVSRAA